MLRGDKTARGRIAGLALVLCLTVLGQWSAIYTAHQEHHPDEHCCQLCHIGPYASLDSVTPIAVAPVFVSAWTGPEFADTAPRQRPVCGTTSRAPPAASLS